MAIYGDSDVGTGQLFCGVELARRIEKAESDLIVAATRSAGDRGADGLVLPVAGGFAWYVDKMCEITATDRGLREIAFSKAYGCDRVKACQEQLVPVLTKLVERAQRDGYLRPELSSTDMPIFGLLAGTVSEFAGNVDAELWRRYVAILLDGMRYHAGQSRIPVKALDSDELDMAMQSWEPAGPPR